MMPSNVKHLLSGVAIIATLAIVAPVWAQTSTAMKPSTPTASSAPASTAPMATAPRHKRMGHRMAMRHGKRRAASPGNIANRLNAQELARVGSSSPPSPTLGPTPSGTSGGPMAPGTLGGGYGQPSPTQGIPGGNQPSASSHPNP